MDSCTRCANETENTSCFGNLCACNPNATNSSCPVIFIESWEYLYWYFFIRIRFWLELVMEFNLILWVARKLSILQELAWTTDMEKMELQDSLLQLLLFYSLDYFSFSEFEQLVWKDCSNKIKVHALSIKRIFNVEYYCNSFIWIHFCII